MAQTTPPPPPIDDRTFDQVVDETTSLAVAYTRELQAQGLPSWEPPADPTTDPGAALISIFAGFVSQIQTRLNQVLENNHRAYLGLIGTEQQASQAARAPLTFTIAGKSDVEPDVPEATLVAAASAQPQVTFSTETPVHLTLANLLYVYIREPSLDQFYNFTNTALGLSPPDPIPFNVFSAGLDNVGPFDQVEHSIYLSNDTLFAQPNTVDWQIIFGFTDPDDAANFLETLQHDTTWWYSTKAGLVQFWPPVSSSSSSSSSTWPPRPPVSSSSSSVPAPQVIFSGIGLPSSSSSSSSRSSSSSSAPPPSSSSSSSSSSSVPPYFPQYGCLVTVTNPPGVEPFTIDDFTQGWLRILLSEPLIQPDVQEKPPGPLPAPPPAFASLVGAATIDQPSWAAPDSAYYNGTAVDLTKDFFPFGLQPMLGDTFYVASAAVFAKPNALVSVAIEVSQGIAATASTDLLLRWEVLTDRGWTYVDALPINVPSSSSAPSASSTSSSSGSSSGPGPCQDPTYGFTKSCTVQFTLPGNVVVAPQFGVNSAWLRVRIFAGNYGSQFVWDGTKWVANNFQPPALQSLQLMYGVVLEQDFAQSGTCLTCNDGTFAIWKPYVPAFVMVPDLNAALYLCFDRPFTNNEVSTYLQVVTPGTSWVAFTTAQQQSPSSSSAIGSSSSGAPTPPPPTTSGQIQIQWQYFNGTSNQITPGWADIIVDDNTNLLGHSDVVTFIGPTDQKQTTEFGITHYWLRAIRIGDAFSQPRQLQRILPNTVWAANLLPISDELLGSSDGSQSQQFTLTQTPVLTGEVVQVNEPSLNSDQIHQLLERDPNSVQRVPASGSAPAEVWVTWTNTPDFYGSGPTDRNYTIDRMSGVITFGNGSAGMIPTAGTNNVRASYSAGGGTAGNQEALQISSLKSTVPYVQSATNWDPATGGADQETVAKAKLRGAAALRNGDRAVTQQDFIDLAMAASPAVARATAVPPAFEPQQIYQSWASGAIDWSSIYGEGQVAVVIVPYGTEPQPTPGFTLLQTVQQALAAACPPAVTPQVYGPAWTSVTVSATVVATEDDLASQIIALANERINAFLHPLTGNDGQGWDFGVLPYESQFYSILAQVPGVKYVVGSSSTTSSSTSSSTSSGVVGGVTLIFNPPYQLPTPVLQRAQEALLIFSSGQHDITVISDQDGG